MASRCFLRADTQADQCNWLELLGGACEVSPKLPTDAHWNAQSIQEHKRERDVVVQDIQAIVALHLEIIHEESTAFVNIKTGDSQRMDTHAKSSEKGT